MGELDSDSYTLTPLSPTLAIERPELSLVLNRTHKPDRQYTPLTLRHAFPLVGKYLQRPDLEADIKFHSFEVDMSTFSINVLLPSLIASVDAAWTPHSHDEEDSGMHLRKLEQRMQERLEQRMFEQLEARMKEHRRQTIREQELFRQEHRQQSLLEQELFRQEHRQQSLLEQELFRQEHRQQSLLEQEAMRQEHAQEQRQQAESIVQLQREMPALRSEIQSLKHANEQLRIAQRELREEKEADARHIAQLQADVAMWKEKANQLERDCQLLRMAYEDQGRQIADLNTVHSMSIYPQGWERRRPNQNAALTERRPGDARARREAQVAPRTEQQLWLSRLA
ncbi:hypothetical protein BV25DRAFT_810258 [Artomyces pyxidatus]|uniref:Uncharacterized protein n=1 Tax=Artomyces pyxidatus TaxID=48021 RepID=A0ACB8SF36_9AGAM|nr:hypothetical protein BV25DRAFT_810258 [Artomyces pyxidatus]